MDVVSLHQHGVDYAVATLGTATTPAHVEKLLKLADELFFCFDGDEAGRKAAWRALENSLEHLADGKQVSFMFFPEGEDPDSYVRKCAADDVWKALPLSEFMVSELAARVDMSTVEGRARFLDSAKPLMSKVAAPALSLQLRRRLATKAEVTVGGISTAELSSQTMAAQRVPGLYAIGEAVDVTGWLGGYNFQWAWASGWAAGMALGESA
jgi:DNA primase